MEALNTMGYEKFTFFNQNRRVAETGRSRWGPRLWDGGWGVVDP